MKNQLSDEQLDALMRTLVNNSAADEALLSDIADSPATWWSVQRQINEQKAAKLSAWPPVGKVLRWFLAGASVAAATVLILSLFIFRPASNNDKGTVAIVSPASSVTEPAPETVEPTIETKYGDIKAINGNVQAAKSSKDLTKPAIHQIAIKTRTIEKKTVVKSTVIAQANNKEEIKTEFIALSYARDPESGQIVRVKVPSSMMVSLGLVTSVKAPSEMVDAEVLVGDDGLTRAIRFIR